MDELAREYHDTHDPEIPEEIFELARELDHLMRQTLAHSFKYRESDLVFVPPLDV